MQMEKHPPRDRKVIDILNEHKVSITSRLEDQVELPVTNMWEGMERFMKAVDVVGRSCVSLKEFQHSAEIQFDNLTKQINQCVPQHVHDASLQNLRDIMETKMNSAVNEFQE